jgi:uncharacterized protein (UPF0333 family)
MERVKPNRRKARRGQAMLEYSMLTWVLVIALVIGVSVKMIPGEDGERKNVIELFLGAMQTYFNSFYLVLNMPLP